MPQSSNILAIVSGLVIAILLIVSILIVLIRFYRFLFQNKNIFGNTLRTRIASLGITSLFFSTGVIMIFYQPFEMLFQSMTNIYYSINDISQNGNGMKGAGMGDLFTSIFGNLNQKFQSFRIVPIILAIAAWSLIGQLIDSFNGDEAATGKTKNIALRQNIILGMIFILSIYLSFAAIITVPYFTEATEPNQLKEDFLKVQLDEIQKNSGAKTTLMIKPDAPEFEKDTNLVSKIESIPNPGTKAELKQIYNDAKDNYISNLASRKNAYDGLEQSKVKFSNKLTEEETRLLAIYSIESPNLKSQLKISFRNSLVEHYKGVAELSYVGIEQVNDGIWYADENLKNDILAFKRGFNELFIHAATDSSGLNSANEKSFAGINSNYYFADNLYLTSADYDIAIPAVPSPGDDLGIFKDIAQWLIKPLSMALVLIVGMLGFGLFGAVISTFVKEAKEQVDQDGVIIRDVTGVIIRGVSAAIVIFLAVKGGLAIFSSGEGEPNPYALFFTCLIGAVYSEKIWEWAKEKLSNNFKTENGVTVEKSTAAVIVVPETDLPEDENAQ
ncbi:hypothetical protein BH11BAC7_BH11BAC7_07930 [soil metagenome]